MRIFTAIDVRQPDQPAFTDRAPHPRSAAQDYLIMLRTILLFLLLLPLLGRSQELGEITVPTLSIGTEHDTMDPEHMEWMAGQFPNGRYLYLPDGSHMAMYDDQERYFEGVIDFIQSVDSGAE